MVVLNKPGAGGALALSFVAKAKPDGYTIALSGTNLAMGKAVNPGVGYHPVDDFAAVSNLITQAVFLCVRSDSEIKTLAQYIEEVNLFCWAVFQKCCWNRHHKRAIQDRCNDELARRTR